MSLAAAGKNTFELFSSLSAKMAFDISAHHALMDGFEMSQGFVSIQNALSDIENFLK